MIFLAALHFAASPIADVIELEDGSSWAIRPTETYRTYNWHAHDPLTITPIRNFRSLYSFQITNTNTDETVAVNLAERSSTQLIQAIDKWGRKIQLSDGSIWTVSPLSSRTFDDWAVNDRVTVGDNNGFFSYFWPQVLINCSTISYIEASKILL